MPSKRKTAARRLVAELYRATGGRLRQMRSLPEVAERAHADVEAVYHAVKKGWVEVSPENNPHSIELTDKERSLIKSVATHPATARRTRSPSGPKPSAACRL
jgi:hypothetical protein